MEVPITDVTLKLLTSKSSLTDTQLVNNWRMKAMN